MRHIFKMQLGQILNGRKKWFVVLLLLMPVALTYVTMNFGGLGRLKERMGRAAAEENHAEAPTTPRDGQQRLIVTDEPREFANGRLRITPNGAIIDNHRVPRHWTVEVDRGYVVVDNGQTWIDESKKPRDGHSFLNIDRRGGIDPEMLSLGWDFVVAIYLFLLYPQTICLLLALFYGSSLLNGELEGKTLTYLFTRPIPRWQIVTGKYAAIVCALAPPAAVSLAISWMLMGAPDPGGVFLGILVGAMGAIVAYNAVFVLLGFLAPRRAMVLALIYGVVFEFILSFVPALVNEATVTYYLRSMVLEITQLEIAQDVPREITRIIGGASLQTSLLVLASIVVVALGLSSRLAARREYPVMDQ